MSSMLMGELIGRIGMPPQWKENQNRNGNTARYVQFSVAHNYIAQNQQETTWVTCFAYGLPDKIVERLEVGAEVFVRGRLSTRTYANQANVIKVSLSISATEIKVLHLPPSSSPKFQEQEAINQPDFDKNISGYYKSFDE